MVAIHGVNLSSILESAVNVCRGKLGVQHNRARCASPLVIKPCVENLISCEKIANRRLVDSVLVEFEVEDDSIYFLTTLVFPNEMFKRLDSSA